MDQIVAFLSQNVGFVLLFAVLTILLLIANIRSDNPPTRSTIASNVLGSFVLSLIIAAFWNVVSSAALLQSFIKADFLQAFATMATAFATIALWIVTSRLTKVTRVQVHALTAPLIASIIYLREDPAASKEVEDAFFLPAYAFVEEDAAVPEINSYHADSDAASRDYDRLHQIWEDAAESQRSQSLEGTLPALLPEPPMHRKLYVVVRIFNAQAASAYGLATSIEIDAVLTFARYSMTKGGSPSTKIDADQMFAQPRTLRVQYLAGQGGFSIAAFRVDGMPFWQFRIDKIRHSDYRGKSGTFAVGGKSAFYSSDGLNIETGTWPPLKDEQP